MAEAKCWSCGRIVTMAMTPSGRAIQLEPIKDSRFVLGDDGVCRTARVFDAHLATCAFARAEAPAKETAAR